LAALSKRPVAVADQTDLAKEDIRLFRGLKRFAVKVSQAGLIVERIQMTHTANKANVNRPFGPGRRFRIRCPQTNIVGTACDRPVAQQQMQQRGRTHAAQTPIEKAATIDGRGNHVTISQDGLNMSSPRCRIALLCVLRIIWFT
jgi:hypothetical protein